VDNSPRPLSSMQEIHCSLLLSLFLGNLASATVRLRNEHFDPWSAVGQDLNIRRLHGTPRLASVSDGEQDIYIAHMDPKLSSNGFAWTEQQIVQATGYNGKLLFIPENSFLFFGTPKTAFKMESLTVVDWVGKLHSRHRKNPMIYTNEMNPGSCSAEPVVNDKGEVKLHEIVILMFPITPERTQNQARNLFDKWTKDLLRSETNIKDPDYEFTVASHDRFALSTKSACNQYLQIRTPSHSI
jgi:hypothetical protein